MKEYKNEQEILEALERQIFLIETYLDKQIYSIEEIGGFFLGVSMGLHNTQDLTMDFLNKEGEKMLNLNIEEFKTDPLKYLNEMMYPGDFEKGVRLTSDFILKNDNNSSINFIQRIRPNKNKDYQPLYTVTRQVKKQGSLVNIVIPIKKLPLTTNKMIRDLEEVMYFRKHYKQFTNLTTREKEIITLLALGYQNNEIAEQLFISKATVEQHRKNLKRKLEIKRFVDLIRFAQAFDLI